MMTTYLSEPAPIVLVHTSCTSHLHMSMLLKQKLIQLRNDDERLISTQTFYGHHQNYLSDTIIIYKEQKLSQLIDMISGSLYFHLIQYNKESYIHQICSLTDNVPLSVVHFERMSIRIAVNTFMAGDFTLSNPLISLLCDVIQFLQFSFVTMICLFLIN